jgi:hypothetical protein
MHVEAVADELAEDGELRAVVEGRDLELLLRRDRQALRGADGEILGVVARGVAGLPVIGFLAGRVLHVVAAGHVLPGLGLLDGLGVAEREGGEAALHRAVDAEFFRERAGVDLADAGDAVFLQVGVEGQLAAPVADDGRDFADDEARAFRRGVFIILGVDAVVADLRAVMVTIWPK